MTASRSLFPLFAALVVIAIPGFAQPPGASTTVTFAGGGAACNGSPSPMFNALSLLEKVTQPASQGNLTGRPVFDDIVLTKSIDDCSVPLYILLFQGRFVRSVVISLHVGVTEVLRITLSDVLITSISETDPSPTLPSERVALSFGTIVILDPATGVSATYHR